MYIMNPVHPEIKRFGKMILMKMIIIKHDNLLMDGNN